MVLEPYCYDAGPAFHVDTDLEMTFHFDADADRPSMAPGESLKLCIEPKVAPRFPFIEHPDFNAYPIRIWLPLWCGSGSGFHVDAFSDMAPNMIRIRISNLFLQRPNS